MNTSLLAYAIWAGASGYCCGPLIAWAIRAWPGHESLEGAYLRCQKCKGGMKRGCCNAGSVQDFWYAILSAGFGVMGIAMFGGSLKAVIAWIFCVSAMIITVVDVRYLIIPDTLSINGCWAGLLYAMVTNALVSLGCSQPSHFIPLWDSILGFLIGGGFLWGLGLMAIFLLKKEGMGFGDVKLLAAMGAWMGWKPVVGIVILSSIFGSIGGIGGIIYNRIVYKQKYRPLTHMIPFGPYLCVGFLIVFLGGMEPLYQCMDWYQSWMEILIRGRP